MRVAINGLGRIGRQVLRQLQRTDGLELVAVNDLADPAGCAHLIKHDSVHGRAGFPVGHDDGALVLDGRRVPLFREADPGRVPFGAHGAQVVLECTGRFVTRPLAAAHLRDGVARVLVGAPCAGADATVVVGVNDGTLEPRHRVVSAGCAAGQTLALLVQVLDRRFGVRAGLATAVESYGNDQRILDLPHPDPRMARAAALSMIPAPSTAADCLAEVMPATRGLFQARSVRVPTPDVSLLDLCATLERDADADAVNAAFAQAASARPDLVEVLDEPLVSVDLRGSRTSCRVDPFLTRIMAPRFVKVFGWYDNEAAYAARLVDLARGEVER
jgi:glyceraldehyde 3-phosphate dehydrogenase